LFTIASYSEEKGKNKAQSCSRRFTVKQGYQFATQEGLNTEGFVSAGL
jgi:hypothetical protein